MQKTKQWLSKQLQVEDIDLIALKGGKSSKIYRVKGLPYVIRQIEDKVWMKDEPNILVQEKEQLQHLEQTPINSPRFIAMDHQAIYCDYPTLLMSYLPGTLSTSHIDPQKLVNQLASQLKLIHKTPLNQTYTYQPYRKKKDYIVPSWTRHQAAWEQLITYVNQREIPEYKPVFLHRDYHLNNVLWHEDKIVSVVDWINSCIGPRYVDLAHCKWNLAVVFNSNIANSFEKAYGNNYDVYWDIIALFDLYPNELSVYEPWNHIIDQAISIKALYEKTDLYVLSLLDKMIGQKSETLYTHDK